MNGLGQRPKLSIVVPTAADIAGLEATLVSVLENRPADCEIVVPIACRYDDPWKIAEEVRLIAAPPHAGLGACVNLGVAAARGRVIHLLAAGWRATHGWADAALARFDDDSGPDGPGVVAVVPLAVSPEEPARVVSAGLRLSLGGRRTRVVPRRRQALRDVPGFDPERLRPSAPVLEAGFWRSDLLRALPGGFAATCGDGWCDADMAVLIEAVGGRVVVEGGSVVLSGAERPRSGPFVRGLQAERVFWRSLAQRPLVFAVVLHLWEVIRAALAEPLTALSMLLGRAVAALQFGSYFAHARTIGRIRRAWAEAGIEAEAVSEAEAGSEAEATPTVRIDHPHPARSGPHRRRERASSLRKTA